MNNHYRPSRLLLQWHISNACNLRCTHCYQDSFAHEERGLEDWQELLCDYLAFLRGPENGAAIRGHINITGGEPFALRDFPTLLEKFAQHRTEFSVGILSNGTLIDRTMARRLRSFGVSSVQVSIDGTPATHDRIRGAGNHTRATAGIRALVTEGIHTIISFTAQPANFREFGEVARLGQSLGVARVWSDRAIPAPGSIQATQMLSVTETTEYLQLMAKARAALPTKCRTEVSMHRALQFQEGGYSVYRCTAGDSLITIMPDGTLYPCRRLPIAMGNAYEKSLSALYNAAPMQAMRTPPQPDDCKPCAFAGRCQGGLRCLSWAIHGRLDQADPGCGLTPSTPSPENWIPIKHI